MTLEQRSRTMAAVRRMGTAPEQAVRRALFEQGFRFWLNRLDLPGTRSQKEATKLTVSVSINGETHVFEYGLTYSHQ